MSTRAERLGTGIEFDSGWDFSILAGSLEVIDGLDVLGRDLAFALQQEIVDLPLRGEILDVDTEEEVRILIERILSNESRVEGYEVRSVTEAEPEERKLEVELFVKATSGENDELIILV